ncbi:MAG: tyrosine--tRNA ligase [Vicingaceae bacterium]
MELLEELKWRGLLQDYTPGLEELLKKGALKAYAGFDPTAHSLHIGNLVPVMLLLHFQRHGHVPVVLMGGATGMIGDPSGKSKERQLLDLGQIEFNLQSQKKQLEKFIDFSKQKNKAELVNNNDWFADIGFLSFLRDVGKHITINYMMAKDSVKSRMDSGISFAEFTYQLVQGYDFYHLFKNNNVSLQVGGSDQWGNMLTGTELIRRKDGGEAHVLTAPLITKADGTKFGKSEGGNIWLDSAMTSPYKFYQYWLNTSDEDAVRYVRIFSLKGKEEIETISAQHLLEPHTRLLQKTLAEEMTIRIHSKAELQSAVAASMILFGKSTKKELLALSGSQIQEIFADVPQFSLKKSDLTTGISVVDFLAEQTKVVQSKGEAKRMLNSNAISINQEKVTDDKTVNIDDLLGDAYIIVQRGKKNFYLITVIN